MSERLLTARMGDQKLMRAAPADFCGLHLRRARSSFAPGAAPSLPFLNRIVRTAGCFVNEVRERARERRPAHLAIGGGAGRRRSLGENGWPPLVLDEPFANPPYLLLEEHGSQLGETLGRIVECSQDRLPLGHCEGEDFGLGVVGALEPFGFVVEAWHHGAPELRRTLVRPGCGGDFSRAGAGPIPLPPAPLNDAEATRRVRASALAEGVDRPGRWSRSAL
jgi:hypothetical protein